MERKGKVRGRREGREEHKGREKERGVGKVGEFFDINQ